MEERKGNFREVEQPFPRDKAREEASRCLECGCMAGSDCLLRDYATEYGADQDILPVSITIIRSMTAIPLLSGTRTSASTADAA
ncbi:MAG: hypothetical protein U5N26_07515 [Candidatus Marinimicrobia bacterium]|nr:hypothetical protein [Candidatus Neomarinimicrobiota bacterium]